MQWDTNKKIYILNRPFKKTFIYLDNQININKLSENIQGNSKLIQDYGVETRQLMNRIKCQNKRRINDTNVKIHKRNKPDKSNATSILNDNGNLTRKRHL